MFRWPDRREISLALPIFLVVSLLTHAATFYLFQIVYPPSAPTSTPPAEASFWPASVSDPQVRLWLEANDPALMTKPREAVPPQKFKITYQPFFDTVRAEPQQINTFSEAIPFPDGFSIPELLRPKVQPAEDQPAVAALHTQLEFSAALRRLAPQKPPEIHFSKPSSIILQSASFFIGVSAQGEVTYTFIKASSGNPAIDNLAEAYLSSLRCQPSAAGVKWGFATFHWGVEAMRSASKD